MWTLLSLGFAAYGMYAFRHADRQAELFNRTGRRLYGAKVANHVYTARNLRWGAASCAVGGSIFVIFGIVKIFLLIFAQ